MASRKRMLWASIAIVATLMIGVPSLFGAQARGAAPAAGAQAPAPAQGPGPAADGQGRGRGRGGAQLYTPAAGARDLKSQVPALTNPEIWRQSDGALFWKISTGRADMPGFEDMLSEEQRWHVVNYLRATFGH